MITRRVLIAVLVFLVQVTGSARQSFAASVWLDRTQNEVIETAPDNGNVCVTVQWDFEVSYVDVYAFADQMIHWTPTDSGGCTNDPVVPRKTRCCFVPPPAFGPNDRQCSTTLRAFAHKCPPPPEDWSDEVKVFIHNDNDDATDACVLGPDCGGCEASGAMVGDPINVVTGVMSHVWTDFVLPSPNPIQVRRRYDSSDYQYLGIFGLGFRTEFEPDISLTTNGRELRYTDFAGNQSYCVPPIFGSGWDCRPSHSGISGQDGEYGIYWGGGWQQFVEPGASGMPALRVFQVLDPRGTSLDIHYDVTNGKLLSIEDTFGRKLAFEWGTALNPRNRVTAIHLDGDTNPLNWIHYTYDTAYRKLEAVSYPDGTSLHYEYKPDERLTKVKDGHDHIVAAWDYDGSGRADHYYKQAVDLSGNVDEVTIQRPSPSVATVTDALTNVTTYAIVPLTKTITSINGPCRSCPEPAMESRSYEWNNRRLTKITSAEGRVTTFDYGGSFWWPSKITEAGDGIPGSSTEEDRITNICYDAYGHVQQWARHTTGSCSPGGVLCDWNLPSEYASAFFQYYSGRADDIWLAEFDTCEGSAGDQDIHRQIWFESDNFGRTRAINRGSAIDNTDHICIDYYGDDFASPCDDGNPVPPDDPCDDDDPSHKGWLCRIVHTGYFSGKGIRYDNYDARGNPQQITDTNDVVMNLTYDKANRITSATLVNPAPGGFPVSWTREYDDHEGQVKRVTGSGTFMPFDIELTVDAAHRLNWSKQSARTHYEEYGYDRMSRRVNVKHYTDPMASPVFHRDFGYDQFDRLRTVTFPTSTPHVPWDGSHTETNRTSTLTYHSDGALRDITDPLGHVSRFEYDPFGRLWTASRERAAGNSQVQYTYDSFDHLATLTDPKGGLVSLKAADLLGTRDVVSPDRGHSTYDYHDPDDASTDDNTGDLRKSSTDKPSSARYKYDSQHRLTDVYVGPPTGGDLTLLNVYDNNWPGRPSCTYGKGRLCASDITEVGVHRVTNYAYDFAGRPTLIQRTRDGVAEGELALGYQPNQLSMTYPSGRAVTFQWSSANQTVSVNAMVNGVSTLVGHVKPNVMGLMPSVAFPFYDSNNPPINLSLQEFWQYDSNYKPTFTYLYPQDLPGQVFTYNADGLPSLVQRSLTPSLAVTLDYDELHEVTTANGPWGNGAYSYDVGGNRTATTVNVPSAVTYAYTDTARPNRLTATGGATGVTFTYDDIGNVRSDGLHNYEYDRLGRLWHVDSGSNLVTIEYDANSRPTRLRKETSPTTIHDYYYDLAGHLIEERRQVGTTVLTRDYVWYENRPLARIDSQSGLDHLYYYSEVNHLGVPLALADYNHTSLGQVLYDPYGQVTAGDLLGDSLRFPGQFVDPLLPTLYLNWHRVYVPALGRYLQADPTISGGRHVPHSWNQYAYAAGNPVVYIDPQGLFSFAPGTTVGEQQQVVDALDILQDAANRLGGHKGSDVAGALGAYGPLDPNDKDVVIGFGDPGQGKDGGVDAIPPGTGQWWKYNKKTKEYIIPLRVVLRRPGSCGSIEELAEKLIHEGSHVRDWKRLMKEIGAGKQAHGATKYDTERQAYTTQGHAAEGMGRATPLIMWNPTTIIWTPWAGVSPSGIDTYLANSPLYGVTPASPGDPLLKY